MTDLGSPYDFSGYTETDADMLRSIEDSDAKPIAGFVVDRYGIKTRVDDTLNFWPGVDKIAGAQLLGFPIPDNFHWSTIEWVGLVRAAMAAEGKFRIMELGAAWGPASVSGSVIARLRGIHDIRMTAVEGDPHHFRRLKQHVEDNGFPLADQRLYHAAVAVKAGVAHWPVSEPTSVEFGFRPMADETDDYMHRAFAATFEVKLMAMADLVRLEEKWDLIHIDVQGSELDLCKDAMPDLLSRARRVIIGTHSRVIEGNLLTLFADNGWILENEKPCKFIPHPTWTSWESLTAVDGAQVWFNPKADLSEAVP